jgi:hypothetical protein
VTANAVGGRMRACQRKSRVRMVKRGRLPGSGVMALCTGLGELIGHVIGAGGTIEIGLMAGITIC